MKRLANLSESEQDVMEVIWKAGDWVDIERVHQALSQVKKWAYNTVGTFMIRLTEKQFLRAEKRGKTNFYLPIVTEEEYRISQTTNFLKTVHRGSKKSLIAALYSNDISPEELDELIHWIDER